MPEAPPRAVRVALVNDYEVVVKGLREMLADFADRVQVVELDLGVEVEQSVDVALYDCFAALPLHTDDLAGLVGQGRVGAVAVYTWATRDDLVRAALATGARGWLSKSLDAASVVTAVERLASGEQVVLVGADADAIATGETGETGGTGDETPDAGVEQTVGDWPGRAEGLSPRQAEIICLITQGLSNSEICERTYLTLNTVKSYIREAYRTIGVATRVQAVLWGVEHQMVPAQGRRAPDRPEPGRRRHTSAGVPPPGCDAVRRRRRSVDLTAPRTSQAWGRDLVPATSGGPSVFFFFSNRLGCAGSLMISVVVTALLVLLLWR